MKREGEGGCYGDLFFPMAFSEDPAYYLVNAFFCSPLLPYLSIMGKANDPPPLLLLHQPKQPWWLEQVILVLKVNHKITIV